MSKVSLHWTKGSLTDQIIAGLFRRLSCAFVQHARPARKFSYSDFQAMDRNPGNQIAIQLCDQDAFWQEFDGRTASNHDLSRIAENTAGKLCPIADEAVTVIAAPKPGAPGKLNLLQVRSDVLEELETRCLQLGISSIFLVPDAAEQTILTSPSSDFRNRRERRLMAVGLLFLLAGLTTALSGIENSLRQSADHAEAHETLLRNRLLVRSEAERQIGALGALAALAPELQIAESRLLSLAELSKNTPDSAWWTRIELNTTNVRLTGTGQNAGDVLKNLTAAYPGQTVRFAQTVSDITDGNQSFVIEIEETQP